MNKKLLVIVLFICGLNGLKADNIVRLNQKRLPYYHFDNWKYSLIDSATFSSANYDDKHWAICKNTSIISPKFNGKAWFRLTFFCDTTFTHIPLSVALNHLGASEIYMDGKRIIGNGKVLDSLNSKYYNPQDLPIIFNLTDTGKHVLAIQYANYDAIRNANIYHNKFRGFEITLDKGQSGIDTKLDNTLVVTFISILMTSVFMMLGLLHLFLFLYDRKVIANIYLSIFMLSLAALFFIIYLSFNFNDPFSLIYSKYSVNFLTCLSCIMLSLFINYLFGTQNKIRFFIILLLSIASCTFYIMGSDFYKIIALVLFFFTILESTILILKAIIKKVKGAKILGFGILLITLYFTSLLLAILIKKDNFDFNDSTLLGLIMIIIGAVAVISLPFSMTLYVGWNFATINKNLAIQIKQTELLSQKNIEQEQEKVKLISSQNEQLEIKVSERTKELTLEKKKSDDLLLNILPLDIAEELKLKGESNAKLYDNVSVLFTDFVDFTKVGEKLSPESLVEELNFYFTAFDHIIIKHGLEKIKTIGDAYMAVCGIPHKDSQHALKTINAANEIIEFVNQQKEKKGQFDIRIGINSGPVVAGIIGVKKFAYDIWGDTVNTAARMEQNSEAGKINISGSTYELVKNHFKCTYRGKINAKNKGDIDMYFIES